MEQTIAQLISRATGAAFAATSRPALTFFLAQCAIALALKLSWIVMVPSMMWLVSGGMLVFGLLAAVGEILIEHGEEFESLLRNMHADKWIRLLGTIGVSLLMISIGAEQRTEMFAADTAKLAQHLQTLTPATHSGQPMGVKVATVLFSIGLNQGLTWLRGYLLEWLDDFHLKKIWQYVETGGVVGFLILLAVAPLLILVLAGLVTLVMVGIAGAVKLQEKVADARRRRPCPACGHPIRTEAFVCWRCKTAVEPAERLGANPSETILSHISRAFSELVSSGPKGAQSQVRRI